MPTKIRLQRFGKKGQPFYRIVVADNRAPRDGKFIENLGTYNPLTKPATIDVNLDRALYWIQVGAQPTDTARAILSYKGILYKSHLLNGVKKGALTQEQADVKFNSWLEEKQNKIQLKIKDKESAMRESLKKKLQEEVNVNETRAKAISEKRAKLLADDSKVEAKEEVSENLVEETPKAEAEETPKAEAVEAPKAEVVEAPKAEVEEAPKAEVEEAPKAEVEETPAQEKNSEEDAKSE